MTNEQSIIEVESKINTLKQEYISHLNNIVSHKINDHTEPTLTELLHCQQLGTEYFNFVENFVGNSGLLGAHANGKWITGFSETCHSILNAFIEHIKFLRSYSNILDSNLISPDINAYANMQRMTKEYLEKKQWKKLEENFEENNLPTMGFKYEGANDMNSTPRWQLIAGLAVGVVFAMGILIAVIMIPNPTQSQFFIFRGTFAISLAGISAIIPGLLNVESRFNKFSIKATGAIAVFIIVWFLNPPALL